jgi:Ca2+-binding RTX toxin-like protein
MSAMPGGALAEFQQVFDRWRTFQGDLIDLTSCLVTLINELPPATSITAFASEFANDLSGIFSAAGYTISAAEALNAINNTNDPGEIAAQIYGFFIDSCFQVLRISASGTGLGSILAQFGLTAVTTTFDALNIKENAMDEVRYLVDHALSFAANSFSLQSDGHNATLSQTQTNPGFQLHTGSGDDIVSVHGGTGHTISTGAGNDEFYLEAVAAPISPDFWNAGDGTDRLVADLSGASVNTSVRIYNLGSNFEVMIGGQLALSGAWIERMTVTGGSGNDQVIAGDEDDILTGNGGNESLDGRFGSDRLDGGAGDDYLEVNGEDSDFVDGGSGSDRLGISFWQHTQDLTFRLSEAASASGFTFANGTHVRNVESFTLYLGSGNDQVWLDQGDSYVSLGSGSDVVTVTRGIHDLLSDSLDDRLIVDYSFSALAVTAARDLSGNFYATAGDGTFDRLHAYGFTDFTLTGGSAGDMLSGYNGNDILTGNGGNDSLDGRFGSDRLDGGAGTDQMFGGGGDDTFFVDNPGDQVFEAADEGHDYVTSSVSYVLSTGAEVELVSTSDNAGMAAISLTGNSFNQTLIGNAGANVLHGGGGTDVLIGYGGNDIYFTDVAATQAIEAAGGGTDALYTSVSYVLNGSEIELLSTNNSAGTAAINLTGNGWAQTLLGNNGANILHGGGGNDTLIGLGGNDTYYTDVAATQVVEAVGGGNDALYTSVSYALAANSEIELLSTGNTASTAAINLTGNGFNQTLVGNNGANTFYGGAGSDILFGYGGNDTFFTDVASTYVNEAVGGGNDALYTSVSYVMNGAEVEFLSTNNTAGTAAINLTGNGWAQTLLGNNGANVLHGGGGADTLIGLGGNDTYYTDVAATQAIEAAGGGTDALYTSVSYVLTAASEVEFLSTNNTAGTVAINLTGNELAQTLLGNAGANTLNGGAGNDALYGFGGADIFAFTTAPGAGNVDTIADFAAGTDRIALDDAVFAAIGGLGALNGNAFFAGAAAHDADDRIVYNSATGQLFYDADGTGAGAAILFATLQAGTSLAASDFTVI